MRGCVLSVGFTLSRVESDVETRFGVADDDDKSVTAAELGAIPSISATAVEDCEASFLERRNLALCLKCEIGGWYE